MEKKIILKKYVTFSIDEGMLHHLKTKKNISDFLENLVCEDYIMSHKILAQTWIVYAEHINYSRLCDLLSSYPCAISPLHDSDKYESGKNKGELKKPHYHVLFQTKLDKKTQHFLNGAVGNNTNFLFQDVFSYKGCLDYLTHKNNENKAKYSEEDVFYTESWQSDLLASSSRSYLKELCDIIIKNQITEYCDFAELLFYSDDEELAQFAFRHEAKMKHLIDSLRYRNRNLSDIDYLNNQLAHTQRDLNYQTELLMKVEKDRNEMIKILKSHNLI